VNNLHSRTVKIGQLDIHYLTGGAGEPLIIIHGGGVGANAWLENATELSKRHRVYVPDLPGFGRSQSMGDNFSVPEFSEFVEQFSLAMGLERFHLLGHSIGGCIALDYAFKYSHRVKKLVLISSFCLGKELALWVRFLCSKAIRKSVGELVLTVLRLVRWLARSVFTPSEQAGFISRFKMNIGKSFTTLKGQAIILQSRLSELVVPTLVVWGAKDNIVPVRQAYAALQAIPDGHLHVFEGLGHSPFRQNVVEFSEIMSRFLS